MTTYGVWPDITEADEQAVLDVLRGDTIYGATGSEVVKELESRFAEWIGSKYCVAVSSCTAAIHTALHVLGTIPGDKVIVPVLTFSGTVHPVMYCGAEPIFVDVDETGNMDPSCVEDALCTSKNVRAMVPVHLHGSPCNMEDLTYLSTRYGVEVVEDACQAVGARFSEQYVGTFGEIGCFSMSSSKPFTGGQGGLLVTNDAVLAGAASEFRRYGEISRDYLCQRTFIADVIGQNYILPAISAALALSQFSRLDIYLIQAQKRALELIKGLPEWAILLTVEEHGYPNWHKLRVLVPDRDDVLLYLREAGVPAALWGTALVPEYPIYSKYALNEYPTAKFILENSVILFDETHPLCVQGPAAIRDVLKILDRYEGVSDD